MIELEGVSKFYGQHRAIEGVNLRIGKGEIVGLLGLNGAGKSTILKIIGTYLAPSAGEISVDGYSVKRDPEAVRARIGFLPDHPPLYKEMTVRDFLIYVTALKDVPAGNRQEAVARAIERTNLGEVAGRRLSDLSHGYRQRVGIAQALVHQPPVIILDEPINGLDPIQIVEMRDLILSLKGDHTVILSSHILSEITRTCDRIMIIDQGRLVAEGAEQSLKSNAIEQFEVHLQWRAGEGILAKIRDLNGVLKAGEPDVIDGVQHVQVNCQGDMRHELANTVINGGGQLLGLSRKENNLESLFLELVKGTDGEGAHE